MTTNSRAEETSNDPGFEFSMGQSDSVSQEKKDGDLHMCIDYRKLNKQMVPDKYPLPRINDLLDQLTGMKYFTTLDMAVSYTHLTLPTIYSV